MILRSAVVINSRECTIWALFESHSLRTEGYSKAVEEVMMEDIRYHSLYLLWVIGELGEISVKKNQGKPDVQHPLFGSYCYTVILVLLFTEATQAQFSWEFGHFWRQMPLPNSLYNSCIVTMVEAILSSPSWWFPQEAPHVMSKPCYPCVRGHSRFIKYGLIPMHWIHYYPYWENFSSS